MNKTQKGEMLILGQAIIYGLFPVMVSFIGGKIPPIFFASMSSFVAAVITFFYAFHQKSLKTLNHRESIPYIIVLSILLAIGYMLVFMGGGQSSGINVSILLPSEILFTFVISWWLFKEPMNPKKVFAGALIFLGNIVLVYKGNSGFHVGNLLVLLATFIFPFANYCARKALEHVASESVLFIRYVIGGFFLLLMSFLFEKNVPSTLPVFEQVLFFLLSGGVFFGATKIIWYEGMKRLELSKAISLGMVFTPFGVIYSILLLNESISVSQGLGFLLVMIGAYLLTRKTKEPELGTVENI